jgi:hypothetical protein
VTHTPFGITVKHKKWFKTTTFDKRPRIRGGIAERQNPKPGAGVIPAWPKLPPFPSNYGQRCVFARISMLVRAFPTHRISANGANNFLVGQNSLHAPPDPCTGLPSVFNGSRVRITRRTSHASLNPDFDTRLSIFHSEDPDYVCRRSCIQSCRRRHIICPHWSRRCRSARRCSESL